MRHRVLLEIKTNVLKVSYFSSRPTVSDRKILSNKYPQMQNKLQRLGNPEVNQTQFGVQLQEL